MSRVRPQRPSFRWLLAAWTLVFVCGLWLDGALAIGRWLTGEPAWHFIFTAPAALLATIYVAAIWLWWQFLRDR